MYPEDYKIGCHLDKNYLRKTKKKYNIIRFKPSNLSSYTPSAHSNNQSKSVYN
jgi:hypothetical protein